MIADAQELRNRISQPRNPDPARHRIDGLYSFRWNGWEKRKVDPSTSARSSPEDVEHISRPSQTRVGQ
jgi:hypothetical protein